MKRTGTIRQAKGDEPIVTKRYCSTVLVKKNESEMVR